MSSQTGPKKWEKTKIKIVNAKKESDSKGYIPQYSIYLIFQKWQTIGTKKPDS